jgi:hypothetical protein
MQRAPLAVGSRITLGTFGSTTLYLGYTDAPWSLPVDAFTVPAGAVQSSAGLQASLDGGLARRFRRELGENHFAYLEALVSKQVDLRGFGPENPVLVDLPEELRLGERAGRVFVATASGPEPTVEHAAQAAAAIARRAWSEGIARVAISLLGSGDAGLDSATVARAMLEAVLEAGPYAGAAEITFTTYSTDVIKSSGELMRLTGEAQARIASGRPIIAFGPDDLEHHVREALVAAQDLARSVVRPAHVLRAVLAFPTGTSPSFDQLRAWVRSSSEPLPLHGDDAKPGSSAHAFAFSPELYEQLVYGLSGRGARGERRLWGRELLAAVLLAGGPELEDLLRSGGTTLSELRDHWHEFVTADDRVRTRTEWDAWWAFAGVPKPGEPRLPDAAVKEASPNAPPAPPEEPSPHATLAPSISVAATGTDDPWAIGLDDRLGVSDEAKAFARLAAAEKFRPPLAVGVFGEWGSGKSFFMRLLYEHVERLAAGKACPEAPEAGSGAFLKEVVQVRFNAWHYVETNLWASLVDHLFTELDRWVRARQEPKAADALLENLSTARELTLEAAEQLVRHRKEQRDAADRLARAEQVLKGARVSASGSFAVWWAALGEAITPRPGGPVNEELTRSENDFKDAARKLGLEDVKENAQAFEAAAEALGSEAGRARLLRRGLLDQLQRPWRVALFALACLVAPAALVFARDALTQWIPGLDELHAVFLTVCGILASATAILGGAAQRVRSALNLLDRSKAAMDAAVAERLQAPGKEVKKSQAQLTKATAEAEEARALLAATSDRLAEATREYTGGTGTGRLLRFIRARATDGQYARHLGLIASIRKDFEELAAGISAASEQSHRDRDEAHAAFAKRVQALVDASGDHLSKEEKQKLLASGSQPPPAQKAFQRIVLYIDDLDRCPPRKVVEVLQAVHMLLTFPLFVVVVAVDVRWVSRALERHYPDLLEPPGSRRAGRAASAHDYLEKIFQIPYWVREMGKTASCDFMKDRSKGLVAVPAAVAPTDGEGRVAVKPSVAAGQPNAHVNLAAGSPAVAQGDLAASPSAAPAVAVLSPTVNAVAPNAVTPNAAVPAASPEHAAPAPPPARPVARLDARALVLDTAERDFLEKLAPYVGGSPRRALRFLNVYCVVKASLGHDDLDRLQAGGYRALMTQLAIATGTPLSLSAWLAALASAAGSSLDAARATLAKDQRARDGTDRSRLDDALDLYAATTSDRTPADAVKLLLDYSGIAQRYSFTG